MSKRPEFWSPDEDGWPAQARAQPSDLRPPRPSSPASTSSSSAADASERILGQVDALRAKVNAGRDKIARLRERNEALLRDNDRLEGEIEQLALRNAKHRQQQPKGGRARAAAPTEATAAAPGELELADEEDDGDILAENEGSARANCLARLVQRARRALRAREARLLRQLPIVQDVAQLSDRYGASMAVYFSFCAWLVMNASAQALIFLPLLAKHVVDAMTGAAPRTPFEASLPGSRYYFWAWYSSFLNADGALYAGACAASLLLVILTAARKYIAQEAVAQRAEIYGQSADKMRTARAVLDGWELQVDSAEALAHARAELRDRLELLVSLGERQARIDRRTLTERNGLRARRLVGIVISFSYTGAVWAGIISLQLNALAIGAYLNARAGGLALLADVGIPVVVSLANITLPVLTMQVTKFERWDFPSTTVRLQILRLYLGKILNLLLNVAGYGLLVARQGPAMQFELALVEPDDARYGCAENQVGAMLFLFVVVEFVVDKLATLGRIAVRKHVLPALTGAAYTREPFPTAQKVINLIYFQALLWLCAPYFPYMAALGPALLYATFYFDAWLLQAEMAKPTDPWSADEVGSFFFRIFFITLGIAGAWYYLFLNVPGVHGCGPHAAAETPYAVLQDYAVSVPYLSTAYALLSNALVLWGLLALMGVRGLTGGSYRETLRGYADGRISQLSQRASLLETRVRMQERQLATLRRQRGAGKGRAGR